jgi:hypothetical protein
VRLLCFVPRNHFVPRNDGPILSLRAKRSNLVINKREEFVQRTKLDEYKANEKEHNNESYILLFSGSDNSHFIYQQMQGEHNAIKRATCRKVYRA